MTTYYFAGGITPEGIPYRGAHQAPISREINVPSLIANGGLVDSSNNALSVPSTGFSDEDILKIPVSKGTLVKAVTLYCKTAEGGACTVDIGCQTAAQNHLGGTDQDGFMAAADINSAGSFDITAKDDAFGTDYCPGLLYITDGYIDIEFNTDLTAVAVFEIAVDAVEMWNAAL